MKGLSTPFIWPSPGKGEKESNKRDVYGRKRGGESQVRLRSVSSNNEGISFQEAACCRQFGELGEVFFYFQIDRCIRRGSQPHPITRRYLPAVEDVIRCFASFA
jgi:hypothetical protein